MTVPSLLTQWARLLLSGLARAGVSDVVVSPGSRSTPFTWAATAHPDLRAHVILDERSAGFFALGQAKISGRPSLLISTSGSAPGHYLPAVLEANASYTPLVVLSADRPLELQACGAHQTVDQVKLFGDHCRAYFELGEPDVSEQRLRSCLRVASQIVAASLGPLPGAVHLNARARMPLEPTRADTEGDIALSELVGRLLGEPLTEYVRPAPGELPEATLAELATRCRGASRGLIVCGPLPPRGVDVRAVAELAEASGFALFCEATSQLRLALPDAAQQLDGFEHWLRSRTFRERCKPDLILQLGATPTSLGLERWFTERPDLPRVVIAEHGWPDPHGHALKILAANPWCTVRALTRALSEASGATSESVSTAERERRDFSATLVDLNRRAWAVVDAELEVRDPRSTQKEASLAEARAVRLIVDHLRPGSLLALGNSLPIREVELFTRAAARDALVWSQRGTNGIDGLVSGAAGAAMLAERPTTLLLGDISFLHDLGGLWAARLPRSPFVIVVLDNAGGRIFEQLPLFGLGLEPDRLNAWVTPHGLDLGLAGPLFGMPCQRVSRPDELVTRFSEAQARPGPSLLVVTVSPHGAAELAKHLQGRFEAEALRSLDFP